MIQEMGEGRGGNQAGDYGKDSAAIDCVVPGGSARIDCVFPGSSGTIDCVIPGSSARIDCLHSNMIFHNSADLELSTCCLCGWRWV